MNDKIIFTFLFCFAALIIIYALAYAPNKRNVAEPKKDETKNKHTETKAKSSRQAAKKRTSTTMNYRGIPLDISMIPPSVNLDETLLPYSVNRQYGFGKRFNTFIVEDDILHFHKSTCETAKSKHKTLIHKYVAIQNYQPCNKCNPNSVIDDWYLKFLTVNFGNSSAEIKELKSQLALENAKMPTYRQLELE